MAKVTCPNCKTEFEIVDPKDSHFCGYHPIPKTDEVIGELVPASEPKKSVNAKGESKKMAENKGTTMEELMAMVMENQKQMTKMMVAMADKGEKSAAVPVSASGDGLGKTSGYYNKMLCGYMWNPYLDRRFLPALFRERMKKYDLNMDLAIKNEESLMESVKFCIKECKRLATMEKVSPLAFEERSKMWTVKMMRNIFIEYWNLVLKAIDKSIEAGIAYFEREGHLCYIKFNGSRIPVTVSEVVTGNNTIRPRMKIQINCFENGTDEHGNKIKVTWKLPLDIKAAIRRLEEARSYEDLYGIMSTIRLINLQNAFIRKWVWGDDVISYIDENEGFSENRISKDFIEGYKKSGAYFTMQDDIKHHELSVKGLEDREAMAYTKSLVDKKAYEIYAIYKQALGYKVHPGYNDDPDYDC